MSLNCGRPSPSVPASSDPEENPMSKRKKPKWRLVFFAILFNRALVSLSRRALGRNKQIFRSPSYVAIDVDGKNSVHHDDGDQIKKLSGIVREKSLDSLLLLGGVKGIAALLGTDERNGIPGGEAQLSRSRDIFGANNYKIPPAKSFLSFVYEASKGIRIVPFLVGAIFSLVIDTKQHGWKEGWYDGGSIIVVTFLAIIFVAGINFEQNRQFEKLSNKKIGDIKVEVVRNGCPQVVPVFEVVVGDVVSLKIGDQIPADGLFLNGHSLKVDESSMSGRSVHVEINDSNCPFLLSGTKVIDGSGSMLVASVGMNTVWGETMSSISRDLMEESTPLKASLSKLNSYFENIAFVAGLIVLFVLLIRDLPRNSKWKCSKAKDYDIMVVLVRTYAAIATIVLFAIPECLPIAVSLIITYSKRPMRKDNALVRIRSACEQMATATTICTDNTGTLTLNEMKVTEFWPKNTIASEIPSNVYELLREGAALTSTGTTDESNSVSPPEISESPTEKAIISWAVNDLGINLDNLKKDYQILHVEAFNSEKKRSGVLMKRIEEKAIHTHWKGAAEVILAMCSHSYDRNGAIRVMNDEERVEIGTIIKGMVAKSLICIAFAHTQVPEGDVLINKKLEESGLTLVGIVGLKYPCRHGVRMAVESCKRAGVNVKLITGDHVYTARATAIECGILSPSEGMNNGAVVEGVQFRSYSDEERMVRIENISVMARSSPSDKHLMVKCLKQKGHVVAVVGDGTNDAPALKEADIGLCMGIQGTEVAKESSDIVILDDNFSSVMTALSWGRCVYNNIQKFIQLQLTVNVAALVINFTAAVSSGDIPLTAIQLLWVNLIMETMGALALATVRPTKQLMTKPPVGRTEPLITKVMWRNLLAQAFYQVIVLLTLQFKGMSIFSMDEKVKNTLIFNIFVLCQIFNEFNARNMEKKNIFEGLHKSKRFIGFVGMSLILQVVMVEFLTRFFDTKRLNWGHWSACFGFAAISWLIDWVVKLIPADSFHLFQAWRPFIKWKIS